MRYVILLFLIGWLLPALQAQDDLPEEYQQFSLKFYPSFLLDVSGPSLEGGFEYRFSPRWSAQIDFGYISTWEERYFISPDDMEGYRLRGVIRKYRGTAGGYHALTIGYKRVLRSRTDIFCRDGCNYFEEFDYEIQTDDFSAHYLFGIKTEPWKHGVLEFNAGAGARVFRRMSANSIPEDATPSGFNDTLFRIEQDRWFVIPSILLSMQVGFGR